MVPAELYTPTWPLVPTLTTTRLGTVWPGTKPRFEARGSAVPAGKRVRKPGALGWVTVTFITTALHPRRRHPAAPGDLWVDRRPRADRAGEAAGVVTGVEDAGRREGDVATPRVDAADAPADVEVADGPRPQEP